MMMESGSEDGGGEFCVGLRVEVEFEGDWYPGDVTGVFCGASLDEDGDIEVQCDVDDDGCITTITSDDRERIRALYYEDAGSRQEWLQNDLAGWTPKLKP